HALREMHIPTVHYGLSIIQHKGIDQAAWQFIHAQYPVENMVFIDGWTGKGTVAKDLLASLQTITPTIQPRLPVLTYPGVYAWLSAADDDWPIPFGILGAAIAGLISRPIWQQQGLHAVMFCQHLAHYDISQQFIHTIDQRRKTMIIQDIPAAQPNPDVQQQRQVIANRV